MNKDKHVLGTLGTASDHMMHGVNIDHIQGNSKTEQLVEDYVSTHM